MGQGERERCGLATIDALEENIASAIVEVQALIVCEAPTPDQYDDAAEALRESLSLVRLLRDEVERFAASAKGEVQS